VLLAAPGAAQADAGAAAVVVVVVRAADQVSRSLICKVRSFWIIAPSSPATVAMPDRERPDNSGREAETRQRQSDVPEELGEMAQGEQLAQAEQGASQSASFTAEIPL
jgi:hypothetical protein